MAQTRGAGLPRAVRLPAELLEPIDRGRSNPAGERTTGEWGRVQVRLCQASSGARLLAKRIEFDRSVAKTYSRLDPMLLCRKWCSF